MVLICIQIICKSYQQTTSQQITAYRQKVKRYLDKSAQLKIILIPQPKHILWVLKRTPSMFKLIDNKYFKILRSIIRDYLTHFGYRPKYQPETPLSAQEL